MSSQVALSLSLIALVLSSPDANQFYAQDLVADKTFQRLQLAEQSREQGDLQAAQEHLRLSSAQFSQLDSISRFQFYIIQAEIQLDSGNVSSASVALHLALPLSVKIPISIEPKLHRRFVVAKCRERIELSDAAGAALIAQEHLKLRPSDVVALAAFLSIADLEARLHTMRGMRQLGVMSDADFMEEVLNLISSVPENQDIFYLLDEAIAVGGYRGNLNSQTAKCLLLRGKRLALKETDKAIQDYQRVIDLGQHAESSQWIDVGLDVRCAHHGLGELLERSQPEESLRHFRAAVEACPEVRSGDLEKHPVLQRHTIAAVQQQRLNSLYRGYQLVRANSIQSPDAECFQQEIVIAAAKELVETYEKTRTSTDKTKAIATLSLATLLTEASQHEEAAVRLDQVATYIAAASVDPSIAAETKLMLGENEIAKSTLDLAKARSNLHAAISLAENSDPQSLLKSRGILGLARVDALTGYYAQALERYDSIIHVESSGGTKGSSQVQFIARLLRGSVLRSLGIGDRAIDELRKVGVDFTDLNTEQSLLLGIAEVEALLGRGSPDDIAKAKTRLTALSALIADKSIPSRFRIEFQHQQAVVAYAESRFEDAIVFWTGIINQEMGIPERSVLSRSYFFRARASFQLWSQRIHLKYRQQADEYRSKLASLTERQTAYIKRESQYNRSTQSTLPSSKPDQAFAALKAEYDALAREQQFLVREHYVLESIRESLDSGYAAGRPGENNFPVIDVATRLKDSKPILDGAMADAAQCKTDLNSFSLFPNLRYVALCNFAEVSYAQSVWYGVGSKDVAIAAVHEAIDYLEQSRAGTGGGEFAREAFLVMYRYAYDRLVGWLVAEDRLEEAWLVAERTRSRSFLDVMQLSDNSDSIASDRRADDITKLRDAREKLARLELQLKAAAYESNTKQMSVLQQSIAEARQVAALQETSIHTKSLVAASFDEAKSREVLSKLKNSDDLWLSFYIASERGYVFVFHPVTKALECHQLSLPKIADQSFRTALDNLVNRSLRYLRNRDESSFDHAQLLAKTLLPYPIVEHLRFHNERGVGNVYLLLHGSLHRIPIAGLPWEDSYVIDICRPISHASSAMVYDQILSRPIHHPSIRLTTFAYEAKGNVTFEEESEDVAQVFRKSIGEIGVRNFVGAKATRSAFVHTASDSEFLHVSAHGVLDPTSDNLRGFLALADEQGLPDTGQLTTIDIRDLNLYAELVVLSACSTRMQGDEDAASAKYFGGEATNSIANAFLVAGAKRVVGTHWEVEADPSRELVTKYFELLAGSIQTPGQTRQYAKSLTSAQLYIRNTPAWEHPHYWAGFAIQGEASGSN